MKAIAVSQRALDASTLLGVAAGIGLLIPAFVVPGLGSLALPAFVVLVPSLLLALR